MFVFWCIQSEFMRGLRVILFGKMCNFIHCYDCPDATSFSFRNTFTIAYVSSPQYFKRFFRISSTSSGVWFAISAKEAEASAPLWTPSKLW